MPLCEIGEIDRFRGIAVLEISVCSVVKCRAYCREAIARQRSRIERSEIGVAA